MAEAARPERAARADASTIARHDRALIAAIRRVLRDRTMLEAVVLLAPLLLVGLIQAAGPLLWLAAGAYLACSAGIALYVTGSTRARRGTAPVIARIALAVAMVALAQLLTGRTQLLSAVYLPVVSLSAFGGPQVLAVASVAALGAQLAVLAFDTGSVTAAMGDALGFAAVVMIVAVATRLEVRRMHRARHRMRRAMSADRRRSRQLAGVEAIGRILAAGPTPEALDQVVERISTELGYRYVSLYLGTEHEVRLGAERGYGELVDSFDGSRGIVGRVMRTRRPAFVPDVAAEPDYWGLNPDVRSEICVPLLADGAFLGFINVESTEAAPLDATDVRAMIAVADRLAAALTIGRERQRLAQRVDLFRQLNAFGEAVNASLEPDELYPAIVRSVSTVVRADVAALHVLDRPSGRYLLGASQGGHLAVEPEVRTGEGLAGRAVRDRAMILDGPPGIGVAVPLIRDRAVLGALTIRRQDGPEFSELDRDALSMIAEQSALAVTNAFLHAEVRELAIRDPLTGLFNRRYLDAALEQLVARRRRATAAGRAPLAAIMFDLDHFSDLNNRHGHQIGDEVLRAFGGILRGRLRAADFVARYGGEEFAVILFRATTDDAIRIADEIRLQLAAVSINGADGKPVQATVSAGCAAIGPEIDSAEELLRAADVALYMAKRAGRNQVCAA